MFLLYGDGYISGVGTELTFSAGHGSGNVHPACIGMGDENLIRKQTACDISRIRFYENLSGIRFVKTNISCASLNGDFASSDYIAQRNASGASA